MGRIGRLVDRRAGRRPKATLQILAEDQPPPDVSSGGGALVSVILLPEEHFTVRRGWLELILATTRFSRTTLDGYREHTREEVWHTVELFENVQASPGDAIIRSTTLLIPEAPADPSEPLSLWWQAKVSIKPEGRQGFSAIKGIRNPLPKGSGPPVVDGAGFLPY